jgi:hypothetical protein
VVGGGREAYMLDHPVYTGYQPSAAPPKDRSKPLAQKGAAVPKYQPNGSGRDTFQNVDLSIPRQEFKLREYPQQPTFT